MTVDFSLRERLSQGLTQLAAPEILITIEVFHHSMTQTPLDHRGHLNLQQVTVQSEIPAAGMRSSRKFALTVCFVGDAINFRKCAFPKLTESLAQVFVLKFVPLSVLQTCHGNVFVIIILCAEFSTIFFILLF